MEWKVNEPTELVTIKLETYNQLRDENKKLKEELEEIRKGKDVIIKTEYSSYSRTDNICYVSDDEGKKLLNEHIQLQYNKIIQLKKEKRYLESVLYNRKWWHI